MNEITMTQTELTVEDTMIHALQELKKLKEGQSVLSADVDYLKNEQPVNPSICLALEKMRKQKVVELLGGKDSQAELQDMFGFSNEYLKRLKRKGLKFRKQGKYTMYDLNDVHEILELEKEIQHV